MSARPTKLVQPILTTDQIILLIGSIQVALDDPEKNGITEQDAEMLMQLATFLFMVYDDPAKFPAVSYAKTIRTNLKRLMKGPAQKTSGRNRREERRLRRKRAHAARRRNRQ